MPVYIHLLNEKDHEFFLSQGRKDPITKETLKAGDKVVICGVCKTAFTIDTWEHYNGCIQDGQSEDTLSAVPKNENIFFKEPVIHGFISDRRQFSVGQPVVFTWSVENATAILINDRPVSDLSYFRIYPREPGTFTLSARNNKGWAKDEPSIELTLLPIDIQFTASSRVIQPGKKIALNWEIRHAIEAEIDQGIGSLFPVEKGSFLVSPKRDTVYSLTANNGFETKTVLLPIKLPEVKIVHFAADKEIVVPKSKLRITWRATNAVRYELAGYGEVGTSGVETLEVDQAEDFELKLTAFGLYDEKYDSAVIPIKVARINEFRLVHHGVGEDRLYGLSWQTTGFDRIWINEQIGEVNREGDCTIPTSSTSIVYRITGQTTYGESISQNLPLRAAEIESFRLVHPFVYVGMQSKLVWSVKNSHLIEIDQGIGQVEGSKVTFMVEEKHKVLTMLAYGDINVDKKVIYSRIIKSPSIETIRVPIPVIGVNVSLPGFHFSPKGLMPNILNKKMHAPAVKVSKYNFWKNIRMKFQQKTAFGIFFNTDRYVTSSEKNLVERIDFGSQRAEVFDFLKKRLNAETINYLENETK